VCPAKLVGHHRIEVSFPIVGVERQPFPSLRLLEILASGTGFKSFRSLLGKSLMDN
jgi:hypothetical protein